MRRHLWLYIEGGLRPIVAGGPQHSSALPGEFFDAEEEKTCCLAITTLNKDPPKVKDVPPLLDLCFQPAGGKGGRPFHEPSSPFCICFVPCGRIYLF